MNINKADQSLKSHKDRAPKWELWPMRSFLLMGAAVVSLSAALLSSACSFRTPSTETPIPASENTASQGIAKTFFEEVVTENVLTQAARYDSKGRMIEVAKHEKRAVRRPKTFLCGWAPINENGALSHQMMTHAVHMPGHCNLEFEITEDNLIGRMVNPSFPNDRNRWKQVLLIPIEKHFYLEKSKDSYGRETNEIVENGGRSDWSSRPQMKLNLSGMRILDEGMGLFWDSRTGSFTKVSDIEWDNEKGFLGFTIDTTSPVFGADYQGRFRVNFLRFTHNPGFQRTPYNSQNSRYLNALHILGEKIDGVSPVLYAAHWDLTKKHKVYLHGFPTEHISIAQDVVNAWNNVFSKKLGLPAAFELDTTPSNKYGFDLRYPSLTWVDDPLISAYSALGIGIALSDVKNGEILWGNVTLYGGIIERYIKSFLPGASSSAKATAKSGGIEIPKLGAGFFSPPSALPFPTAFHESVEDIKGSSGKIAQLAGETTAAQLKADLAKAGLKFNSLGGLVREQDNQNDQQGLPDPQLEQAKQLIAKRVQDLSDHNQAAAAKAVEKAQVELRRIDQETQSYFAQNTIPQLLGLQAPSPEALKKALGNDYGQMNQTEMATALLRRAGQDLRNASGAVVFDTDRRFVDVVPGWAAAMQANKDSVTYESALRTVVKELVIHEFGHFLGLGHQFKENILPEEGTVPEKIVAEFKLRERAQNGMTNATSVMGYKSPVTEMSEREEEVAPGPQDELVLRYLYKGEYATYKSGDADFKFVKVPKNGIIPSANPENEEYKTSYFPQCNDFQASTASDPFCNRFDRGYDAETITKSYFDELNDNMISRLISFTDARGGNTDWAEGSLWSKSLMTMGRIRLFYDYMRQKYASEFEAIGTRTDDLYDFSKACFDDNGPVHGSDKLQNLLWTTGSGSGERKPTELGQLCRANRKAVTGFTNFLINPGPDSSRMDWNNNYLASSMTGGDAELDSSRAFGTHSAISVLPLKISALNALTTPRPYFFWGPWMLPVPRFDDDQGRFAYSTLYPYEFTQAMAAGVEKNLKFGTDDKNEKQRLGRSVLSMGYFLGQQYESNDSKRFSPDYISRVRNQTNFRLSLVALIMKMKDRNDDKHVTHFETEIYDFRSKEPVRNVEAYLLPNGSVIARAPGKNFVYPITDFSFADDKTGYVYAYRIEYDDKHDDVLAAHSVKTAFEKMHKSVLDSCLVGQNNGLSSFFNSTQSPQEYPGFEALPGVAADGEMQLRFLKSVRTNFDLYYKKIAGTTNPPNEKTCEEARKGLALIFSSVGLLNGYWIPEARTFIW